MTNIENTQQAFLKLISPAHTTLVNFLDQILPSGPVKLSRNHIGLLSMPPKEAPFKKKAIHNKFITFGCNTYAIKQAKTHV